MWIEKLKNGKFRAVERYTDIMTGKQKKVSVTMDKNTAATRKAALAALEQKMQTATQITDFGSMTLSELIEKRREYQKQTVKPSTYSRNYYVGNQLKQLLGENILVSKLTAGYIYDQFLSSGKSNSTLNEYLIRLKAMLRWAYKKDYIKDISYLDKLEPYKDEQKKLKLAEKFLEASELKTLLSRLTVEKWRDLTEFLALSGARIGEAFALEFKDIDLKGRKIIISKTYDASNDIVTSAKTLTSIREVYIQDELLPLARKLKAAATAEYMICGNNRIFFKKRYDTFAYIKYFREKTTAIIGRPLTPHVLRHTHVALLAENGISLDAISRRLGHSDSRITRDVYFHVTEKLKEKENMMIKEIKFL